MDYEAYFAEQLRSLKDRGDYRIFAELERRAGHFPSARCHDDAGIEDITVWCSNDYLGMGQHPEVIDAMVEAIRTHGAGAGGTRNISGTNRLHVLLERELASLHGKDAALIFTSGYVANMTVLSTLAKRIPGCIVYSDAKNHNSMIEGIRHSGAQKRIFKHNDPADLERLILEDDPAAPKLVAFESVYSMDGDIAPLDEILSVCERYNALSFLDEVHAVGMYGDHGAGVAERDGVMHRVDVMQGTLGKAFGVIGGYIAASHNLVDFVRSFGNGFIFTTAMPPGVAAAARKSIQIVRNAPDMRERHQERAAALKASLSAAGLPVMPSVTHIVPVLVGDPVACRRASDLLLDRHKIYVQPINYPTVDRGTERLRLTPTPYHSDEDIAYLTQALVDIWSVLELKRAA
ncbi:5-aminolevulinate synthase [Rhodospirillaceae bacterium KN72]|uniref:5-aminolevulinate synthase n=1 Tax=Pacificispira spongiicola TaxID=2729598 RepID=A0A7Y0HEI3_9PROT|nr:5-aminolevulinate synthase [Pacificispira spongiicola]NMM42967.1 5-aminolevulinate synthase [Pacificispira spongiicola]